MKEVYFYKKLDAGKVQCQVCAHYCSILPGKRGICGVRENRGGTLYALNYGKIATQHVDPIEKKPFFHFLPGSPTYSFASIGCNFVCQNCQNWDIAQFPKIHAHGQIIGENSTPEDIVSRAKMDGCPSIAYTYTEPTIFLEFALDTMKLAKSAGLKNIFVSNGFMSPESAKAVLPYLDANNIDLKGFSDDFYRKNCGAKLQPVLETAKLMKKSGVWVEITTLLIPGFSDSEEMLRGIGRFIFSELGAETPWHLTQFCGAVSWRLQYLSDTPLETLKRAWKIGKAIGLKYVYTGNAPGVEFESTICPKKKCETLCIKRYGYSIRRNDKKGKCPKCGTKLNIIG
ncbi:MAG: AmmeMemoRadiSam system radical SAM enzyme [Candidatus Nealsonbacteria bacterium]|nr:AmmeMemoRadiSam system radical SAM enzyme [Candidatus Nealsonbacteria bacterium]